VAARHFHLGVTIMVFTIVKLLLGCIHINTSPALHGFSDTSSSKHEFACISMAAIHIRVRVTCKFPS